MHTLYQDPVLFQCSSDPFSSLSGCLKEMYRFRKPSSLPTDTSTFYTGVRSAGLESQTSILPMPLRLKNELTGEVIVINHSPALCGRSSNSDVQIPGQGISRKHAWFFWDAAKRRWSVQDISSNGTYINNMILNYNNVASLSDNDVLEFANSAPYRVVLPKPVQATTASSKLPKTIMGMTFFNFKVLRMIGSGGFSKVFIASRSDAPGLWCVKHVQNKAATIAPLLTLQNEWNLPQNAANHGDAHALNQAEKEYDMVSQLHHPNIVRYLHRISLKDHVLIFMEMLEGPTLLQMINDSGRVDPKLTIEIGLQIADILAYLHEQQIPIIYKDLKPQNLIVSLDERIRIIDFGIAEYLGSPTEVTYGTKGYSPPEQYDGLCDPRSDLYSLGITLYHCLSGPGVILDGVRTPITLRDPSVPYELVNIIHKLTEPDLDVRYQSARDVIRDLREAQAKYGKPKWFES